MKMPLFTTAFLFLLCLKSFSQTGWQWGFGAGSTVYFGDLGNEKYIPISGTHYGAHFLLKHDLKAATGTLSGNAPFAIVVHTDWLRIGYDETHPLIFNAASGTELRNFRRGLNFRN